MRFYANELRKADTNGREVRCGIVALFQFGPIRAIRVNPFPVSEIPKAYDPKSV